MVMRTNVYCSFFFSENPLYPLGILDFEDFKKCSFLSNCGAFVDTPKLMETNHFRNTRPVDIQHSFALRWRCFACGNTNIIPVYSPMCRYECTNCCGLCVFENLINKFTDPKYTDARFYCEHFAASPFVESMYL